MVKLSDFIVKLRAMTHDEREIEYSDEDWIRFTNNALRFVRRIILDVYPPMLEDMLIEGFLTPPESVIYLYDPPLKISKVHINGEKLRLINSNCEDERKRDKPYGWYMFGRDKIMIAPPPKFPSYYVVTGVQDFEPLKKPEDILPLPSDFEDFVSEYAIMRASVTNEFNTQEESQLTMYIRQGIEDRLKAYLPPGIQIRGYW